MSSKLFFREALHKDDYILALPLVLELNEDLTKDIYWSYLEEMLEIGNYTLLLAFDLEELIGICGYWIATKFYTGKYMEIDNCIIGTEFRNRSYGTEFVTKLENIANKQSCKAIMLDAYLENVDGHRFYERNGYKVRGYHFIKKIG